MKNRSKINKGIRFVNHLVEVLRGRVDKKTYAVGGSGAGLDKNDVRIPSLNIEIEAKNAIQVNLTRDWEQVKRQLTTGNVGVLAIRNPKKPEFEEVLIVMSSGDWIDLLLGTKEEVNVISNKDNDLKWAVSNLKESCSKVLRKLE
ncbi:MAG TPA: hypothetical protein ENH85_03335 [Candidatus Scalindua sp.]|nr:hypothetical protein [Candidatus Scalindua sp.]